MVTVSTLVPLLGIVVTLGLPLAQPVDRFAAVAPEMQEIVNKGEISGALMRIASREKGLLDMLEKTAGAQQYLWGRT